MANPNIEQFDFNKTAFTMDLIINHQIFMCKEILSTANAPEELDLAERRMVVLAEILRPDKEYSDGLAVQNEESKKKLKALESAPQQSKASMIFNLQIDYSIQHFGILMELLKRRGKFGMLPKGTIFFPKTQFDAKGKDIGLEQKKE